MEMTGAGKSAAATHHGPTQEVTVSPTPPQPERGNCARARNLTNKRKRAWRNGV
jgi:hypothetical protein